MALITTDPLALRILLSEDIYHITEPVQPEAAAEILVPAAEPTPYFNYLGDNNAFFLVVVEDHAHEHAAPATVETLLRILKGMKLELKDIALLNLAKHTHAGFPAMKSFFACSKLVLFGIDPKQVGLKEIPGNAITVHENVSVLATYGFEEMAADEQKKRLFWNEMKKI